MWHFSHLLQSIKIDFKNDMKQKYRALCVNVNISKKCSRNEMASNKSELLDIRTIKIQFKKALWYSTGFRSNCVICGCYFNRKILGWILIALEVIASDSIIELVKNYTPNVEWAGLIVKQCMLVRRRGWALDTGSEYSLWTSG